MLDIRNVSFVVGVTLLFVAAMMLLPLGISYIYHESDIAAFGWSLLVTAIGGGALVLVRHKSTEFGFRDGFAIVTFGWIGMALFGALPFYISGSIPSFSDAFFESMSGFTTTGATVITSIETMSHSILFWRSLTQWIGGMGIILLSLAILPLLGVGGMQLYRAEVPGPTKDKLTPRIKDTAAILWMVYVTVTVAEIVLLWFGGMSLFESACHAFATVATGGFSTRDASILAYESIYIHYVIILFMFIAGINFSLHYRLVLKGKINQYWRSWEFRIYLLIIIMFTAIMAAILFYDHTLYQTGSIGSRFENIFRDSIFQVVAIITTTGFVSADWEKWGYLAQILFVALMLVGGMAGSTGGGPKVIRVQVMIKAAFLELKRLIHPRAVLPLRIGDTKIEDQVVRNILVFIVTFALILGISTVILSLYGFDLVTSFGASIASLSNIGPGLGAVGATDNYSSLPTAIKWWLSFLMMLGRLELFTVLVLFSKYFWIK